jgi:hypothetical protein
VWTIPNFFAVSSSLILTKSIPTLIREKNKQQIHHDRNRKILQCTHESICHAISVVDFLDLPNLSASSSMFSNSVKTELHSEQSLSSIENIFFLCVQNNVLKKETGYSSEYEISLITIGYKRPSSFLYWELLAAKRPKTKHALFKALEQGKHE